MREVEEKISWITIIGKASSACKKVGYTYTCECNCGKSFKARRSHFKSILKGTSKTFHCEECFINYLKPLEEGWKWADGLVGRYAVSPAGKVWSTRTERFMAACPDRDGYLVVGLGQGRTPKLHRLIAEMFLPNPEKRPYVEFKDGNKSNCDVNNLEWVLHANSALEGKVFNRLTVKRWVRPVENPELTKAFWLCDCLCGSELYVSTNDLTTGHTKSCGCFARESTVERTTTHNLSATPEYRSWQAAKTRCFNPNTPFYEDYGGRGISMSSFWEKSFEQFLEDMGNKPSLLHSLERIDVNGDYCKENCKWVTSDIQAFNQRKRSTNTSGRTGVYEVKPGVFHVCIKGKRLLITEDYELACKVRSEAELKYYGFTKE